MVIQLSYDRVGFAALLILVNGGISLALKLGLERRLAVAALATVIQLLLIGLVLDWVYIIYDFRDRRALMAAWSPGTILVGGFKDAPPAPEHDRVYVVGDRAIEAWRRLGYASWGVTVPRFLWALVRGPRRLERFTRPDGRKGWAWLIPGDPPARPNLTVLRS